MMVSRGRFTMFTNRTHSALRASFFGVLALTLVFGLVNNANANLIGFSSNQL